MILFLFNYSNSFFFLHQNIWLDNIFIIINKYIYTFLSKLLFAIVGGIQMYIWSKNKHKRNITLFADKYKVKYLLFYKII